MGEAGTRALIARFIDALNRSDHAAALEMVSEDVAHDPFDAAREIGRDKLRWRLGLTARHFDERIEDLAVLTGEGGVRAAADFTLRGTYRVTAPGLPEAAGQRYSLSGLMAFDIDDGVITRISAYRNPAGFRAALGG